MRSFALETFKLTQGDCKAAPNTQRGENMLRYFGFLNLTQFIYFFYWHAPLLHLYVFLFGISVMQMQTVTELRRVKFPRVWNRARSRSVRFSVNCIMTLVRVKNSERTGTGKLKSPPSLTLPHTISSSDGRISFLSSQLLVWLYPLSYQASYCSFLYYYTSFLPSVLNC